MCNVLSRTNAHMRALIQAHGCLDSVAALISARFGRSVSKGTISKCMSGALHWSLADVIALEDAAGQYPITRILMQRLGSEVNVPVGDLMGHIGVISKEAGEAVAAVARAVQSADADGRAQAMVEIEQAIAALQSAHALLDREGEA